MVTQNISYASPARLEWQLLSQVKNLSVKANSESRRISKKTNAGVTTLSSKEVAKEWVISYESAGNLVRHNDIDQIFLKIFNKPPSPIFKTIINFNLPEQASESTELSGNIYTLSGIKDAKAEIVSPASIRFSAGYAPESSLLTISSSWSKDALSFGYLDQARLSASQLDAAPWLAAGFILPIAGFIVLFHLTRRQRKQDRKNNEISNKPPSNIDPILVGVLVRKKIYPEEIASLIISLCQRGYLLIIKRSDSYYIAKRKELDHNIENWERKIINEMFKEKSSNVSADSMKSLNNKALYSPEVRSAFADIYQIVTNYSYFKENPHITRIRNKLFALFIYYTGAVLIVWIAVTANNPYLILPLAGAMIVAQIIIRISPQLANYSNKGIEEKAKWSAFKNFLKQNKPLEYEASMNHIFERYLAYAVALDSTLNWARRFDLSNTAIMKPDWFVTYEEGSTVEFAKEIAQFTGEISKGITSLKGPIV